jgi:hypothetical protein
MKCPYFCNYKKVTKVSYTYDVEGHEAESKTTFGEEQHKSVCELENCGVFQNGKCNYKT